MLIVGVAVARRRLVALTWAALGLAGTMLIMLTGSAFAGAAVMSSVGVPEAALRVLFHAATGPLINGARALLLVALAVALVSWLAGRRRPISSSGGKVIPLNRPHRWCEDDDADRAPRPPLG